MIQLFTDWFAGMPGWARGWLIMAGMAAIGLVIHSLIYQGARIAKAVAPRFRPILTPLLLHLGGPSRLLFPLLAARTGVGLDAPGRYFTPGSTALLAVVLSALIIVTATWLLVRVTYVIEAVVTQRVEMDVEDNLEARRIHTRVVLLRQMLTAAVIVIGVAMVLLLHPALSVLGTGILASAGVAGIVIGIAAQQPVRNLLAGFQIAITQPFRVDDVVIVENEWGRIEEITLTYVVVRIWDLRRLVLPISYFLEKPFQNWTRTSASILGTAFLYVDYAAPLHAIRAKLLEIAEASPNWDRKVCGLQVTELKERTMELRALVSAGDASRAWDLRCEVREGLIGFLKEEHPEALPRLRATVSGEEEESGVRHGEGGT
jgi:small-conductance mechanosensitive channel